MAATLPPDVDVEALYRDLFTQLFRYVFFRTADYDVAVDVTQTSFLKFLSQLGTVSDRDHAQKLLFVIARHTLIDHWRSAAVRRTMVQAEWENIAANDATAEEQYITHEEAEFVRLVIADLVETEAEVVSLRLSGDVSYETIAETLGVTSENARQIYSRALRKIRLQLIKRSNF